jgi:hypothetical protein
MRGRFQAVLEALFGVREQTHVAKIEKREENANFVTTYLDL